MITNALHLFHHKISQEKAEHRAQFCSVILQLAQPAPQEAYHPPHILINSSELKSTPQFTYLGCTISSDARLDKEIDNRLARANSSFGRLYKRVWNNKSLKIKTKIQVYKAVVLTTLLYGSETWEFCFGSLGDVTEEGKIHEEETVCIVFSLL
ncbi:hypothetical protein PoB_003519300 [Plakobranchus ocellatus]|uniref:Uncharacterized protein n=1 Tax=Plakobranchus ocellatus TaxID=259542 RepID=A0AAV4APH0_9GAST|nr:hypothetical protein PoB_003519300 [Plakobranchus ocellatus]